MGEHKHTPGPVVAWRYDHWAWAAKRRIGSTHGFEIVSRDDVASFEDEGNARLFAAARNAFTAAAERLGVNAVELAERMAEGGIAELLEACKAALEDCTQWRTRQQLSAAIEKATGSHARAHAHAHEGGER